SLRRFEAAQSGAVNLFLEPIKQQVRRFDCEGSAERNFFSNAGAYYKRFAASETVGIARRRRGSGTPELRKRGVAMKLTVIFIYCSLLAVCFFIFALVWHAQMSNVYFVSSSRGPISDFVPPFVRESGDFFIKLACVVY